MISAQPNRLIAGVLGSAFGLLGLATAWPGLALLDADAGVCLQVSPAQGWLGVQVHLLAMSSSCAQGSYAPGPALATVVGFSVMVSLSVLLAGLVSVAVAVGLGVALRRTLRRVRGWWRRRLVPALFDGLHRPETVPVPVRVAGRKGRRSRSPQQLRGPPSCR